MDWLYMVINSLKKIASLYKNKGAEILLLEVFASHRWPKAIFSYTRLEILLASSIKPLPKRLLNNSYEVKEAKEEDIKSYIDLRREEEDVPAERYQDEYNKMLDFINSENSLHIVIDNSIVVGFLYVYRNKREFQYFDSIPNKICMKSGSNKIIMFGYGYVSLKYRMKGVFPLLMNHVVSCNPSVEMFITDIHTSNTISINSHRRIGFTGIGNIKLFRVFGICSMWLINLNNKTSYSFRKNINISAEELVDNADLT